MIRTLYHDSYQGTRRTSSTRQKTVTLEPRRACQAPISAAGAVATRFPAGPEICSRHWAPRNSTSSRRHSGLVGCCPICRLRHCSRSLERSSAQYSQAMPGPRRRSTTPAVGWHCHFAPLVTLKTICPPWLPPLRPRAILADEASDEPRGRTVIYFPGCSDRRISWFITTTRSEMANASS